MTDLILEALSLVAVTALLIAVVYTGFQRNVTNIGWNWILAGLVLIFIGSVIDITDHFPSLNSLVVVGDTPTQRIVAKLFSGALAYLFLSIGIIKWLPTLSSVDRVVKAFNRVTESEEELTKAHQSLDLQHKELQSILRNTPDIIFRVDPTGRITFISDAIRNYGYEPETLLGSDLILLIHPEDQSDLEEDFGTPFDGYELDAREYTVRVIVKKAPEDEEERLGKMLTRRFQISLDDISFGEQADTASGIRQGIARDITVIHDMRAQVHALESMVPICSLCKSVRNDEGYWERVEEYITKEVDAPLSHSICPDCLKSEYGDVGNRSSDTGTG